MDSDSRTTCNLEPSCVVDDSCGVDNKCRKAVTFEKAKEFATESIFMFLFWLELIHQLWKSKWIFIYFCSAYLFFSKIANFTYIPSIRQGLNSRPFGLNQYALAALQNESLLVYFSHFIVLAKKEHFYWNFFPNLSLINSQYKKQNRYKNITLHKKQPANYYMI